MPAQSDRELLSHCLGQYLNGSRRGKLRLPHRLQAVSHLTNLSRAQIRKVAYWSKPVMSSSHRVSRSVAEFLHRVAPMRIWTHYTETVKFGLSTVGTRLPRRQAPRCARNVWPSTPDLFEITEMSRRGIPLPIRDTIPIVVENHLTRSEVKGDCRLASRIVATNIVGLRDIVGLPEKFLGSFRSYCGFSILVNRYAIPIGLVRFLIARWISSPASLWLVENCPFRIFLKRHRSTDFIRQRSSPITVENCNVREEGGDSPKTKNEPHDMWSIYVPRMHLFQETSILMEVSRQRCFPTQANRLR